MRLVAGAFRFIFFSFVLLCLLASYLIFSPELAVYALERFLSPLGVHCSVGSAQGNFLSGIALKGVDLRKDSHVFSVKEINIEFQPGSWLRAQGHLRVDIFFFSDLPPLELKLLQQPYWQLTASMGDQMLRLTPSLTSKMQALDILCSGHFQNQPISGFLRHASSEGWAFHLGLGSVDHLDFQYQANRQMAWNAKFSDARFILSALASHLPKALQSLPLSVQGNMHWTPKLGASLFLSSTLDPLNFNIKSSIQNHSLLFQFQSFLKKTPQSEATFSGMLDDHGVKGFWSSVFFALDGLSYRLSKPSALEWNRHGLFQSPLCLQSKDASVCGAAHWPVEGAQWLSLDVRRLNLQHHLAAMNLPVGRLNTQIRIERPKSSLPWYLRALGSFGLQPLGSHFKSSAHQIQLPKGVLETLVFELSSDPKGTQLKLHDVNNKTHGELLLAFENFYLLKRPPEDFSLKGSLAWNIPKISVRSELSQTENVWLQSTAHLMLSGTFKKPVFSGDLNVSIPSLPLSDYGLNIENIQLRLFNERGTWRASGQATSGGGRLTFEGPLDKGQPIRGTIHNALLYHTPECHLRGEGEVFMRIDEQTPKLYGEVRIMEGFVRLLNEHQWSTLSEDLIDEDALDHPRPQDPFDLDLRLSIQRPLDFSMLGVKGQLDGHLRVTQKPGALMIGEGLLELQNPKLSLLGHPYQVRRALLRFSKTHVLHPMLDFLALRKVEYDAYSANPNVSLTPLPSRNYQERRLLPNTTSELRVGFQLQGILPRVDVRMYSEPLSLPPTEILSYVLFGHSHQVLNMGDAIQLLRGSRVPILGLLSQEKNPLTAGLLDEVGVENIPLGGARSPSGQEASDGNHASLVLKKKIGPKLFLSYAVGLRLPLQILRITYDLNRRWSVQTEMSSLASGLDLFYTYRPYE